MARNRHMLATERLKRASKEDKTITHLPGSPPGVSDVNDSYADDLRTGKVHPNIGSRSEELLCVHCFAVRDLDPPTPPCQDGELGSIW